MPDRHKNKHFLAATLDLLNETKLMATRMLPGHDRHSRIYFLLQVMMELALEEKKYRLAPENNLKQPGRGHQIRVSNELWSQLSDYASECGLSCGELSRDLLVLGLELIARLEQEVRCPLRKEELKNWLRKALDVRFGRLRQPI